MSNKDVLKGKWKQARGKIQSKWGKLTNDELDRAEGDVKQLEGLLQERYGMAKEESERQLNEIFDSIEPVDDKSVTY